MPAKHNETETETERERGKETENSQVEARSSEICKSQ